jgi:hypothetical protein
MKEKKCNLQKDIVGMKELRDYCIKKEGIFKRYLLFYFVDTDITLFRCTRQRQLISFCL